MRLYDENGIYEQVRLHNASSAMPRRLEFVAHLKGSEGLQARFQIAYLGGASPVWIGQREGKSICRVSRNHRLMDQPPEVEKLYRWYEQKSAWADGILAGDDFDHLIALVGESEESGDMTQEPPPKVETGCERRFRVRIRTSWGWVRLTRENDGLTMTPEFSDPRTRPRIIPYTRDEILTISEEIRKLAEPPWTELVERGRGGT